jgi:LDH2 family malate/lactate/ureidoglycolate dehydrogenase
MPGGDVCVWWSTGAAPISLAIPTGDQPPIVLDMGSYFSNLNSQNLPELFAQIPDAFFKFLGIAAFAQVLGAVLAGVYDYPPQELRRYADASQGSFVLALDVTRFVPTEEFKRHVDRFLRGARSMAPFPGCDRAEYPGGIEWHLEQEYGRVGVPLSPEHMASLNRTADALGLGTLEEWTDSRQRPASSRQPACPP